MCVYKGKDYTNQIVGCYLVISDAGTKTFPSGQKTRYWKVRCVHCGNEKELAYQKVVNSLQDGCASCVKTRFSGANSFNWKGETQSVPSMYFHKLKKCAEKRGIPFEVSREEIDTIFQTQNHKCVYTGYQLHFGNNHQKGVASLDRKDSNKGYTIENVQWVHKHVNQIKWDLSHEQFLEICKTITENFRTNDHNK